jgi:hypothetical protein
MTGMRSLVIASAVLALCGCKKAEPPADDPPPTGSAKVGHGTFKTHGTPENPGSDTAGSAEATADPPPPTTDDEDVGKPPYRDDSGHLHGPGGPVNMGSGPDCDAGRNHCLRKGVWFAAHNIESGRQFRATPSFTFENKWYDFEGNPVDTGGKLYMTKPVGNDPISAGQQVIYFSSENDDSKWANSEYDALTSSRWEAGVVESVSGDKIRISSWGDVPKDTIREITQTKSF